MKRTKWFRLMACLVAICGLPAISAAQTTRRVPQDFATIQAAINASANGDTVLVSSGTYTENINFKGKAITLQSVSGADTTIIDGGQLGTVVTFNTAEGPSSVLTGFTVRNGTSQFEGSGIAVEGSSPAITFNKVVDNVGCDGIGIAVGFGSPLIQGNIINNNQRTNCSGGNGGGGILIRGASTGQILGNVISNNKVSIGGNGGGGIALNGAGAPTLRSNVILGNTVTGVSPASQGGGIWIVNDTSTLIVQNLIVGNHTDQGGGISWLVPSGARGPLLVNNTIANNDSPNGSAIFGDGFQAMANMVNNLIIGKAGQTAIFCGNFNNTTPPQFSFNDVFSLTGTAYGGICTDQTGTNGSISADPLFVAPANNDYHLQATSPAVDAGNNSAPNLPPKDIDGDNRIINATGKPGAIVDMGADEFSSAQVLTLSTSSLAFGLQPPGTTSAAQSFTFANHGSTAAAVRAVMSAGDFSQTNTCGTSVAGGASCAVSVTFTPEVLGPRNGLVAIVTDVSETPQVVLLSGTGGPAPPQIVLVAH